MDIQATNSSAHHQVTVAAKSNSAAEALGAAADGGVTLLKSDGATQTGIRVIPMEDKKLEFIPAKVSPEMLLHLIKAQENITNTFDHRVEQAKNTNEFVPAGSLPIGVQHDLDDIANDPVYAAKRARELGTFPQLAIISEDMMPKNGDPASVWNDFHAKMSARMERTGQITRERSAYYKDMVEQGMPPAEIYANLLAFKPSPPKSVEGSPVPDNSYAVGGWDADNEIQHAYLEQVMAKSNGAPEQNV